MPGLGGMGWGRPHFLYNPSGRTAWGGGDGKDARRWRGDWNVHWFTSFGAALASTCLRVPGRVVSRSKRRSLHGPLPWTPSWPPLLRSSLMSRKCPAVVRGVAWVSPSPVLGPLCPSRQADWSRQDRRDQGHTDPRVGSPGIISPGGWCPGAPCAALVQPAEGRLAGTPLPQPLITEPAPLGSLGSGSKLTFRAPRTWGMNQVRWIDSAAGWSCFTLRGIDPDDPNLAASRSAFAGNLFNGD